MPELGKGDSSPSRDSRKPEEDNWVARRLKELASEGYTKERAAKQIDLEKRWQRDIEEEERCPLP